MTLNEAFEQFAASPKFKETAKLKDAQGGKLRLYLHRYNAGTLKSGAMVDLLLSNGYEIRANKVTKKK